MTLRQSLTFATFSCLLLSWLGVMYLLYSWHYSYYDLGIYSEALFKLRHWDDLNPWISGRGIHIFSDHFDPIMILVAPFTNLIPAPIVGIALDFLAVGLAWFPIQLLVREKKLTPDGGVWLFAAWVLNNAIQNAHSSPWHPTTWGNLPLFYLFTFFYLERYRDAVIAFAILCTTREEFPLVGIPLAALLFFRRARGPAIFTTLWTLAFLVFQYLLKPRLLAGPHAEYGKILLHQFFANPFAHLRDMATVSFIRMSLERYWPALLTFILAAAPKPEGRKWALTALILGSTMLGIRYASFQWAFHYGPAALLVVLFMVLPHAREIDFKNKWLRAATVVLIIFSLSHTQRMISRGIKNREDDRVQHLNEAFAKVLDQPVKKVLMSNNLASTFRLKTDRDLDAYFVANPDTPNAGPYDLVWVEKPPHGDVWWVGYDRMNELINLWRASPGIQVIQDDAYSFIARGVITNDR